MSSGVTVLDQWATAWPSDDVESAQLFADDCLYEDVPTGAVNRGKDAMRTFARFLFSVAPDFKIEISHRLEISLGPGAQARADRWAAGEWTMSGTQRGDMPNLPATGKSFSIRGASILKLRTARYAAAATIGTWRLSSNNWAINSGKRRHETRNRGRARGPAPIGSHVPLQR
jgi:steroid delta-isomerase-like uncharacterized protein